MIEKARQRLHAILPCWARERGARWPAGPPRGFRQSPRSARLPGPRWHLVPGPGRWAPVRCPAIRVFASSRLQDSQLWYRATSRVVAIGEKPGMSAS
jgi:hypothetical protein